MISVYDSAYDGKMRRWRVRCGFVCQGLQCSVEGETAQNPEAPKASKHKIFCPRHAREDGRTTHGRNKKLRHYIMTLSETDKKRARADTKSVDRQQKKKRETPARARKVTVAGWLGSSSFKECSVFDRNLILGELRVPPLLLGRERDPTRVYLFNSFRLDDLRYLYEKRSDGRQLFFVRGSSIIRCDIISFVGDAWFISRKH